MEIVRINGRECDAAYAERRRAEVVPVLAVDLHLFQWLRLMPRDLQKHSCIVHWTVCADSSLLGFHSAQCSDEIWQTPGLDVATSW